MSDETIKIEFNFKWNENFKRKLTDILIHIWVIINPQYWFMNNSYNSKWNEELTGLMENYDFKDYDRYSAKLGNTEIWIANHPYASFTEYWTSERRGRPSRFTIFKAKMKLKRDKIKPGVNTDNDSYPEPLNDYMINVSGSGYTSTNYVEFDDDGDINGELPNGLPQNWENEID